MTREEHLITILAEECAEVAQRCSKANRFGLSEIQGGQALDNSERICEEARDLVTLLTMCRAEGLIDDFMPTREEHLAKVERVESTIRYAQELGTLSPDKRD